MIKLFNFITLTHLFMAFIVTIFLPASQAHAQESYNFVDATPPMMGVKNTIVDIASGAQNPEKHKLACTIAQKDAYWLRLERSKILHNDLFHEIKTEEQKRDIDELEKTLQPYEKCRENIRLWNAYDDKWYAPERNRAHNAYLEEQQTAVQAIKDSGADIWDGVVSRTIFAIPRQYMWFGSRKEDGLTDGINLRFYAPDLTARMDPEGAYGKNTDIAGVLSRNHVFNYPCTGFEGRKICTAGMYQNGMITRAMDCLGDRKLKPYLDEYKARWRRDCTYLGDNRVPVDAPVYDADVGMMRMNKEVFFEGDPEFPTSFMLCVKPETKDVNQLKKLYRRCGSAIQINEDIYFYYSFPQALFWEHKRLQVELKKKIQGFVSYTAPQ